MLIGERKFPKNISKKSLMLNKKIVGWVSERGERNPTFLLSTLENLANPTYRLDHWEYVKPHESR